MTHAEFKRLLGYWHAKRNKPTPLLNAGGKRLIKGQAAGTGAVLKTSFVKSQVKLEEKMTPRSVNNWKAEE